jgi:hypothetical protein
MKKTNLIRFDVKLSPFLFPFLGGIFFLEDLATYAPVTPS